MLNLTTWAITDLPPKMELYHFGTEYLKRRGDHHDTIITPLLPSILQRELRYHDLCAHVAGCPSYKSTPFNPDRTACSYKQAIP